MSSTITSSTAGKEYRWKQDGKDGMRSYSYAKSNSAWNYSTEPDSSNVKGADTPVAGAYIFSDSSTGQPFARRGNLYNWTAATLGSSFKVTSNGKQTQDSICPRGWQLPMNSNSKSFNNLIDTYSITSSVTGANRIREWPLDYLPTGDYSYSYGYVGNRTTHGFWWSGVTYFVGVETAPAAYYLNSYESDIDAHSGHDGGQGYALRC